MSNKILSIKLIFCLYLFVFAAFKVDAQSKIDLAVENLENNYTQEKIYVLFDKEQYVAGDEIFFQAYIFDNYKLSSVSKTLYVELYDRQKKLMAKKILLIDKGKASGSIALDGNTGEDIYFVRAYTNWMANFGSEWHFIRSIPIYSPSSEKKLTLSEKTTWSTKAFTEGGTFVEELPVKVSVRRYEGKSGVSWRGYVVDSQFPDQKLESFQAIDENVATFMITPKLGKVYQVMVTDSEGNSQMTTLPPVTKSGIGLKVKSESAGIRYTVNAINVDRNLQNYVIVGTIGNQLAYKAKIKSVNPQITSLIPVKDIGENGIMQIAVFDDKDNLVASRLCFLKQNNLYKDHIGLENLSLNNNPRAQNSFEITQKSPYSHLMVNIKDLDLSSQIPGETIVSSLFLTGDLKSPIYNPNQYFSEDSNMDALDALLISEKWKRFDWTKVVAGEKPSIKYNLTDHEYLSYKARLAKNSRPLPNTTVNLIFKNNSGEPILSQFTTDREGYIEIKNFNADQSYFVNYFLNSGTEQHQNLTLTLKPIIESNVETVQFPKSGYELREVVGYSLPESIRGAVTTVRNKEKIRQQENVIEEVKLVKKKSDALKKLNDDLTSGMFSSMNANVFDLVNDNADAVSSLNILDWLRSRAAGLTFQLDAFGNSTPYIRGERATLYLDEMRMDPEFITSLPVSNIAMVKIIKGSGLLGNAVVIYTRKGNMTGSQSRSADLNNRLEIKGYDAATTYQNTNYSSVNLQSVETDAREVLYWNTNVLVNDKENSKIIFFNNDKATNRKITIIAFDTADQLLYSSEIFK